jgi:hypothetical protein
MEELLAVQLPLLLVVVVPAVVPGMLAMAARSIPGMLFVMLVMLVMHMVPLPFAAITAATGVVRAIRAIITTGNLSQLLLIQTWQDNFLFGRRFFEHRKHANFPFVTKTFHE